MIATALGCPECSSPLDAADDDLVCGQCELPISQAVLRQLKAIQESQAYLRAKEHLGTRLRSDLIRRLDRGRDAARAVARGARPVPKVVKAPPPKAEPRSPEEPVTKPRETPEWLQKLKPVAAENALYLLGAFLLVAGAGYFVSTAWTTMSGIMRLFVIQGGLGLLGGLFLGAEVLLSRTALPKPARVAGHLAAGMMPFAAVVGGQIASLSLVMGVPAMLAALGLGWLALHRVGQREKEGRWMADWGTGAAALAALAAPLASFPLLTTVLIAGLAPLALQWLPKGEARVRDHAPALAQVGGATLVAAVHLAIATSSPAPLAAWMAGIALALVRFEGRLGLEEPRRDLIVFGIAIAVAAVAPAYATPKVLLLVGLAGTATCTLASLRTGSAPMLLPALVLSLLGYVLLPAPMREAATALRDAFASGLGYTSEPLPLAWYGVTCLPYVAGMGFAARAFAKRGLDVHALATTRWLTLTALGLCALSIGDDLRAPTTVFFAEGVTLIALGFWLKRRTLTILGPLLIAGAGVALSLSQGLQPSAGLLVCGVPLALTALLGWRFGNPRMDARPMAWAAGLPIVLAGLAFSLPTITPYSGLDLPAFGLLALVVGLRARAISGALETVLAAQLAFRGLAALVGTSVVSAAWFFPLAALVALCTLPLVLSRRRVPRQGLSGAHVLLIGLLILCAEGLQLASVGAIGTPVVSAHLLGLALSTALALLGALFLHRKWAAGLAVMLSMTFAIAFVEWRGGLSEQAAVLSVALAALGWLALTRGVPWARFRRRVAPVAAQVAGAMSCAALLWAGALLSEPGARLPILAVVATTLGAAALRPKGLVGLWQTLAAYLAPTVAALALSIMWTESAHGPSRIDVLVHLGAIALSLLAARPIGRALGAGGARTWVTVWSIPLSVVLVAWCGLWHTLEPALALTALGAGVLAARAGRPSAIFFGLGVIVFAACGPIAHDLFDVDALWLPAMLAGFGLLYPLLHRWPVLGVTEGVGKLWARILVVAVAIPALLLCIGVQTHESLRMADETAPLVLACALFAALVYQRSDKLWVRALALLPLLHALPILASVSHGGFARMWSPDVDIAVLAMLLATRSRRLGVAFAGLALLSTGFDLNHLSTPLTLSLLVGVPVMIAGRKTHYAEAAVHAVAVALIGWLVFGVPRSGNSAYEILAPIAAILVMVMFSARALARRLPEHASGLRRAASVLGVGALAALLANTIFLANRPASFVVGLCAIGSLVALGVDAARRARTRPRGHLELALLSLATLHLFLATRAFFTTPLDAHHALLWTGLGLVLMLLYGTREGPLAERIRRYALLMPLPALAISFGDHGLGAQASLAAVGPYAVAARAQNKLGGGEPKMTWLSLGLLNLAAARLWLSQGLLDPSLFGVPLGMSLIAASKLQQAHLGPRAVTFQLLGLGIAFGSVAIQVVGADTGLHALLLFGLALATVAWGFTSRRGDLLLAGTSAVVLDVVLYLARTGFARDFFGAALLLAAGLVVCATAIVHTRRREQPKSS